MDIRRKIPVALLIVFRKEGSEKSPGIFFLFRRCAHCQVEPRLKGGENHPAARLPKCRVTDKGDLLRELTAAGKHIPETGEILFQQHLLFPTDP